MQRAVDDLEPGEYELAGVHRSAKSERSESRRGVALADKSRSLLRPNPPQHRCRSAAFAFGRSSPRLRTNAVLCVDPLLLLRQLFHGPRVVQGHDRAEDRVEDVPYRGLDVLGGEAGRVL